MGQPGQSGSSSPLDLVGGIPRMLGLEPSHLPLVGGMFTDPAAQAHQQQFAEAAKALQEYQQEMRPVTMQGMRQAAQMYQPSIDLLRMMYGPDVASFDINQILKDPYTEVYGPEDEEKEKKNKDTRSKKEKQGKTSGTGSWSPLDIFF